MLVVLFKIAGVLLGSLMLGLILRIGLRELLTCDLDADLWLLLSFVVICCVVFVWFWLLWLLVLRCGLFDLVTWLFWCFMCWLLALLYIVVLSVFVCVFEFCCLYLLYDTVYGLAYWFVFVWFLRFVLIVITHTGVLLDRIWFGLFWCRLLRLTVTLLFCVVFVYLDCWFGFCFGWYLVLELGCLGCFAYDLFSLCLFVVSLLRLFLLCLTVYFVLVLICLLLLIGCLVLLNYGWLVV